MKDCIFLLSALTPLAYLFPVMLISLENYQDKKRIMLYGFFLFKLLDFRIQKASVQLLMNFTNLKKYFAASQNHFWLILTLFWKKNQY